MECLMDEAPANPTHKCASPARRTTLAMSTEECMARLNRISTKRQSQCSNVGPRQDTRGNENRSVLNFEREESNA